MVHLEVVNEAFTKRNIGLWLISAFKAGFINSAGFLAAGKFVSHITGFGTQVGMAVGHSDYFFGAELLLIPLFFILGGVVTSFVLDRDYAPGERPKYYLVQGLVTFMLFLIILLGTSKFGYSFERFDLDGSFDSIEFSIISLLCFTCGLKNSLITWTTYGKIRVTHLTGLATDLGLNLIRSLGFKQSAPRFGEERIVNLTRFLTLISFSIGAFLSAVLFPKIGFGCFIIVFLISFILTLVSWRERVAQTRSFLSAELKNV